jgi:hypothetical protein
MHFAMISAELHHSNLTTALMEGCLLLDVHVQE